MASIASDVGKALGGIVKDTVSELPNIVSTPKDEDGTREQGQVSSQDPSVQKQVAGKNPKSQVANQKQMDLAAVSKLEQEIKKIRVDRDRQLQEQRQLEAREKAAKEQEDDQKTPLDADGKPADPLRIKEIKNKIEARMSKK